MNLALLAVLLCAPAASDLPPNFVVILADDLGYGDLGCYGHPTTRTPNLDRMAAEGIRLTDFHSAMPVCTPTRTGLMTGCHPVRVGLGMSVLFPYSNTGLSPDEQTLPEILKPRGYASICIGKWHLGHLPRFLPTKQGFDSYFGIPFSNDMGNVSYRKQEFYSPPTPLMRNETVVEHDPDQRFLTGRYTNEAIQFIRQHKQQPFFLYLAHSMPHRPIHASSQFRGKSAAGLYGDVVEELDDSVGRVLATLRDEGLDQRTLVLFTSDNGGVTRFRGHELHPYSPASNGPLHGQKGETWEGGMRVPCIVRWPGRVPAGRAAGGLSSVLDLLPTFAKLAGAAQPEKRIDGRDISKLITEADVSPLAEATLPYYRNDALDAVRQGPWKLFVGDPDKGPAAQPRAQPMLFNLDDDLGESHDVAADHPQVVARLQKLAESYRAELGDARTKRTGAGVRPVGQSNEPNPSWLPEAIVKMKPGPHRQALESALKETPHLLNINRDVVYAKVADQPLTLDAYWPEGSGPWPMLVWIHGGGWSGGMKELGEATCRIVASRGFAVLSVNYRLAPQHPYPAGLNDCLGAVVWAKKNAARFDADPKRVAVAGESAGGNLAAMVAYAAGNQAFQPTGAQPGDPSANVQAAILVYGAFNLTKLFEANPNAKGHIALYATDEAARKAASPTSYVAAGSVPTLLLVGGKDRLLPESQALAEQLQKLGVRHELVVYPDVDHAFIVWDWQGESSRAAFKKMSDWLSELSY